MNLMHILLNVEGEVIFFHKFLYNIVYGDFDTRLLVFKARLPFALTRFLSQKCSDTQSYEHCYRQLNMLVDKPTCF